LEKSAPTPHETTDLIRIIIYVSTILRDKLQPTPDDSAMRRAYQQAVAGALDGK
jgi:hypothetical protein